MLRAALAVLLAVPTAVPVVASPAAAVPAGAATVTADAAWPVAVALWTAPLGEPPHVTRPFQAPASPYGPGHRGVDLAGAPGAVVRAAGAGVVVFAGQVAGRPVISVEHVGGLRTTYEPVTPSVVAGQAVARGSPIGSLLAGHPGCPVGACLHWGLRRGETYLDPLLLLGPPRIRLLPWH